METPGEQARGEQADAEDARDERLYSMAAAHHEDAAASHDQAAARHERRGEPHDAERELRLGYRAREEARRLRRHAEVVRERAEDARSEAAERFASVRELRERLLRGRGAARSRERRGEVGEDRQISMQPDPMQPPDAEGQ